MLKVSVVVPTYKPGGGLNRLLDSIKSQTLCDDEFEVLFVDDGSPDDTFSRLTELEKEHPNFRAFQIPNSGWASRPRNVGISHARGEYVAFMDHDDVLYPRALEAAYEFAKQNHADVLSGKEARTRDAAWAISTFTEDIGNALGRESVNPMIPMNPHKLYRREFLNAHHVRFPDGRRVLWEDIFFNLKALASAKVVSIMSSTPYYHWVQTKGSGSTSFRRSNDEWWASLRAVLEATWQELGDEQHDLERDQLLLHQYKSRILGTYNRAFPNRPEPEKVMANRYCDEFVKEWIPSSLDNNLDARARVRAELLRSQKFSALETFSATDIAAVSSSNITRAFWDGPVLVIGAQAIWRRADNAPWAERSSDGTWMLAVDDELKALVTTRARALMNDLSNAYCALGIRSRDSRIVWMLPTEDTVEFVLDETGTSATVHVQSRIEIKAAAFGAALEDGPWDVNSRTVLGGNLSQNPLKCTGSFENIIGLIHGRIVHLYRNRDGAVSLDIGNTTKPIWRNIKYGRLTESSQGLLVDLPDVHVAGKAEDHPMRYVVRRKGSLVSRVVHSYKLNHRLRLHHVLARFARVETGRLTVQNGRASLQIPAPPKRGTYRLDILPSRGDVATHLSNGKFEATLELVLTSSGSSIRRVG